MSKYLFFAPMTPKNDDVLMPGRLQIRQGRIHQDPVMQQSSCAIAGTAALGAKALGQPQHLEIARKLLSGCLWSYENSPNGMIPDSFRMVPCKKAQVCGWDEPKWQRNVRIQKRRDQRKKAMGGDQKVMLANSETLPLGIASIVDGQYIPRYVIQEIQSYILLTNSRPGLIESLFILYRTTGERGFQDKAWDIFQFMAQFAETALASGSCDEGIVSRMILPYMASLRYFFMIFDNPNSSSLDDYVFTSEGNPLKRTA